MIADSDDPRASFPTRAEIRALASKHHDQVQTAMDRGGNVGHTVIDQADAVKGFANRLGVSEGTLFLNAYAEELEALKAKSQGRAVRTDARAKAVIVVIFTVVVVAIICFIVRAAID